MIFGFRKHPSVDQPSELQRIILRGIIFETSVKIVETKERFSPFLLPLLSRWWRGVAVQFRKIDYALTRVIHDSFSICFRAKINGREKFNTSISKLKFPFNFSTSIFELLPFKILSFNRRVCSIISAGEKRVVSRWKSYKLFSRKLRDNEIIRTFNSFSLSGRIMNASWIICLKQKKHLRPINQSRLVTLLEIKL